MHPIKIKLFLLVVFLISNAHSCEDKKDCHSFKAQISYDGVELLTVQLTNGTAPFTYKWSNGLGSGSLAIAPGPGTYSVTATDLNKCQAIAVFTIL
ncbi:MAG: SprB repeat-containing protein [Saprospiraceae bacterium]|nr:SprB repeat-containing protein [Saprospiraceae bacterium]